MQCGDSEQDKGRTAESVSSPTTSNERENTRDFENEFSTWASAIGAQYISNPWFSANKM